MLRASLSAELTHQVLCVDWVIVCVCWAVVDIMHVLCVWCVLYIASILNCLGWQCSSGMSKRQYKVAV